VPGATYFISHYYPEFYIYSNSALPVSMFNKIRYSADEIYDLKSVICDILVSMMSGNVLRRSGHILTYVFPAHFTLRTIFPFFLWCRTFPLPSPRSAELHEASVNCTKFQIFAVTGEGKCPKWRGELSGRRTVRGICPRGMSGEMSYTRFTRLLKTVVVVATCSCPVSLEEIHQREVDALSGQRVDDPWTAGRPRDSHRRPRDDSR